MELDTHLKLMPTLEMGRGGFPEPDRLTWRVQKTGTFKRIHLVWSRGDLVVLGREVGYVWPMLGVK